MDGKMKLVLLCLSLAFFTNNAFARQDGLTFDSKKGPAIIGGPVDPAMQALVDQFQLWALHKTYNPGTPNTMIKLPAADTKKSVGGTFKKMDQVTYDSKIASAAKNLGYSTPLQALMSFRFKLGIFSLSVGELVDKSPAQVRELLRGEMSEEQITAAVELRSLIKEMAEGKRPVDAKVLGSAVPVADINKELRSPRYCPATSPTRPCEPRIKMSVQVFASVTDKAIAAGLATKEQLAPLMSLSISTYYFMLKTDPTTHVSQWVLEEVPYQGIGRMLTYGQY